MKNKRMAGVTFATVMKWVGIAAVLISFGTTLYELAHSQAELRERKRVVAEQLAAGNAQAEAGDFAAAWESFARASTTAETDGFFAKLLGDLSTQRQHVRTAQENVAMQWVRTTRAPEGHTFSEVVDKLVGTLTTGAASSTGARKADLLAHLGWAWFLKLRSGETGLKPAAPYRDAVAADATNPYANVFWGHWILWERGPLADAKTRFAAAVATSRARPEVRRFQLAALSNARTDEADGAWWQALNEMRVGGEDLEESVRGDLYTKYYFALNDEAQMRRLLAALPPAEHVELQKMLLQSSSLGESRRWVVTAVMAMTLEAAGNPAEALTTWRALLADTRSEPGSTLTPRANAAIKRLAAQGVSPK